MINEIKDTEQALMVLYDKLQGLFPKMHCLDFAVSQIKPKEPPYMYGFIHIGGKCHHFNSITNLIAMVKPKIEKDRILYQNFDRLRKALK